jgi:hypothetical protein
LQWAQDLRQGRGAPLGRSAGGRGHARQANLFSSQLKPLWQRLTGLHGFEWFFSTSGRYP